MQNNDHGRYGYIFWARRTNYFVASFFFARIAALEKLPSSQLNPLCWPRSYLVTFSGIWIGSRNDSVPSSSAYLAFDRHCSHVVAFHKSNQRKDEISIQYALNGDKNSAQTQIQACPVWSELPATNSAYLPTLIIFTSMCTCKKYSTTSGKSATTATQRNRSKKIQRRDGVSYLWAACSHSLHSLTHSLTSSALS